MAFANNILNNLLPSFAIDSVGVYTQDFIQIFQAARAIKATIKEQSKIMEHPVESGIIITDHRIVLPVEIELSLILTAETYSDVYKAIRQYYLNGTLIVIQTKSDIYENQLISSMPHEEDPTQYDVLTVALSLKQVQFVQAQYGIAPKNNSNSNTQKRGTQQGSAASGSQTTIANDAFHKVIG